jgi:hypothetical protein
MNKINANLFLEVSSKTGENIKELFDKISKGLYKKFQNSSEFKHLVQPMLLSSFAKSQSFNLKNNFTANGGNNSMKRDKGCC